METRRIKPETRRGGWQRGCTTEVVYPCSSRHADKGGGGDGIRAIDRIERSYSLPGFVAHMHPHHDEEILTCVRSGTLLHLDSMGHEEKLNSGGIRVMNAGATLHHEERTLGRDPVEGYHFYFHPECEGLEPMVQFGDASILRIDEWRLLASRSDAPLLLRAEASVHEGRFSVGFHRFPNTVSGTGRVLIVFEGRVRIGAEQFRKGDVLLAGDAEGRFKVVDRADLLLINGATSLATSTSTSMSTVPNCGTSRSKSGG